jgi:hypothetical protein
MGEEAARLLRCDKPVNGMLRRSAEIGQSHGGYERRERPRKLNGGQRRTPRRLRNELISQVVRDRVKRLSRGPSRQGYGAYFCASRGLGYNVGKEVVRYTSAEHVSLRVDIEVRQAQPGNS